MPDEIASVRTVLHTTRTLQLKSPRHLLFADVTEIDGTITRVNISIKGAGDMVLFSGSWNCLPDQLALSELQELHEAIIKEVEKLRNV